ncbi:MAG: hypothetical protein AAGJ50_13720 [Pseudomonadota bacterium]
MYDETSPNQPSGENLRGLGLGSSLILWAMRCGCYGKELECCSLCAFDRRFGRAEGREIYNDLKRLGASLTDAAGDADNWSTPKASRITPVETILLHAFAAAQGGDIHGAQLHFARAIGQDAAERDLSDLRMIAWRFLSKGILIRAPIRSGDIAQYPEQESSTLIEARS